MANVRYTGGGSSATLGTKTIDENGVYNASSDDLDGYSQVTVDVPAPSGAVNLSYTANGSYSENIEQYQTAEITVDVPIPTVNTQSKTVTATTSQQTVTPDIGYLLSEVTVNPQQNAGTYTPTPDTAANDMGPVNSYRYVNTSGMIQPTGTKTISIDSNGEYAEGVTTYDNVAITVDVPISGVLGSKTIITNGLYNAIDDNLDGYNEVNVNVPQNATLGIKTITDNGNYYATADGYDGFSRVDVNVAGSTLQANKNVTATTSQQIVTPDYGYDALEQVTVNPQVHTQTYTPAANTAANDMGAQNNYRYVDTSGMVVPGSVTPSNSSPAALTSGSAVTPTANGYAIESYSSVTPSNSSPVTLTSGDIVKLGGNGKAVSSVTNVTPSSTPTSVSANDVVKIGGSGVIVDSIPPTPTSITPSNSSPVALSANTPVNPTESGVAIKNYSYSSAASDAYPYHLLQNEFYKITNSDGYVYASSGLGKCRTGTLTMSTSGQISVNCGFQPKQLTVILVSGNNFYMCSYNSTITTSYEYIASSGSTGSRVSLPSTNNNQINSITSSGFKMNKSGGTYINGYYFAVG